MAGPKTEDLGLPGFGSTPPIADSSNYRVRYLKADLNDPASLGELEIIETKGLDGKEIVLLSTQNFTFMEKYFVILKYLEKRD